jgi:DNA-binding response OmpR family regulator
VDVAVDLKSALALLDGSTDVVVLDLMLPDGDGAKLLERIRNQKLVTRVVVTTGVSDPDRLEALNVFRPDVVLHKPVLLARLLAELNRQPGDA